jgi:hypothetical protein
MTTRREFLERLAAAATATLALPEPQSRGAEPSQRIVHPAPRADAIIVLWMAGGMAAPDTFDPKRYRPFEKGLAVADVISTFPAIPTAIDGVQICDGLPDIASVLDRATLVRSHVQPDLGSILHSRHQYHWHTGYVPPQTVACPHLGAWMARVLGPRNPVMPAFVNIGQRLEGIGENEEIKAFTTAGFFGSEFGPTPWATTTVNRCCGASRTPIGCSVPASAMRSTSRSSRKRSATGTTPAASAAAACSPAGSSNRESAMSR